MTLSSLAMPQYLPDRRPTRSTMSLETLSLTTMRSTRVLLLLALAVPFDRTAGQATPCPPLDTTASWASVNRAWSQEAGVRWSHDSLRHVLLAMRDRDQAARADFGARVTDTLYGRALISLDSTLAGEMAVILDRFGLPTRSMVGAAGSDAAMLIVQHSWPLQERVLALAKARKATAARHALQSRTRWPVSVRPGFRYGESQCAPGRRRHPTAGSIRLFHGRGGDAHRPRLAAAHIATVMGGRKWCGSCRSHES